MKRSALLWLSFFLWVPLLAIAFLLPSFGSPAVVTSYTWRDNGTYDPHVPRYYTRCTYRSLSEWNTIYPTNGRCPFFRLVSPGADQ